MFNVTYSDQFGRTLSLLWLFAILNILFRDIHEMTMAGTISEILSGRMNGNPVTEGALFAGAFAVELLLLAMLLSNLLVPKAARLLNLVLAPVAIGGVLFGVPNDPDDYFFATVEIFTFALIFVLSWNWVIAPATDKTLGGSYAR